jgi:1-phosphofructokinase family hexose kinase
VILSVTLNPSVDHTVYVRRLVPGDTNRISRLETDAGGKGINLARIVARLGGRAVATGFLGGSTGEFVQAVLRRQRVECDFVAIKGATRTNFNVESTAGGPPTTLNARGPAIGSGSWHALLSKVESLAPRVSWVAVGGSIPPRLEHSALAELVSLARSLHRNVALDADDEPLRLALAAGPTFVKPNAAEAGRLVGTPVRTIGDAIAAAATIRRMVGHEARRESIVVVSLGAVGAVWESAEGVWIGRPPKVKARSTIGSGDSLVGAALWALEQGASHAEALRWGVAAGAATATTNGSDIGSRDTIRRLYKGCQIEPA